MQFRHPKVTLIVLVALHVVASSILGRLSTSLAPLTPLMALYLGLVCAQAGLLGIWAGLGRNGWGTRLFGVGFGMAFLVEQFAGVTGGVIAISAITVAAVLLVVRRWVAQVWHSNQEAPQFDARPLQFSIRHILVLMFVTACLLAIGRALLPHVPRVDDLVSVTTVVLCCVTVALPSAWSMLGTSDPFLPSALMLVIALGAGTVLTFVVGKGEDWFWWCSLMVSDAWFLHASLFVVRRCGYRLVRRRRSGPPAIPIPTPEI